MAEAVPINYALATVGELEKQFSVASLRQQAAKAAITDLLTDTDALLDLDTLKGQVKAWDEYQDASTNLLWVSTRLFNTKRRAAIKKATA